MNNLKQKLLKLSLVISTIGAGLIVPFCYMFFTRIIFEPMKTFDIVFACIFFCMMIVVLLVTDKRPIIGFIIGFFAQTISNILGLFNLTFDVNIIYTERINTYLIFGTELKSAAGIIPLFGIIFSSLLIFSSGIQLIMRIERNNDIPKISIMELLTGIFLPISLSGILIIGVNAAYVIGVISPMMVIAGILTFSLYILEENNNKVGKENANINPITIICEDPIETGLNFLSFTFLTLAFIGGQVVLQLMTFANMHNWNRLTGLGLQLTSGLIVALLLIGYYVLVTRNKNINPKIKYTLNKSIRYITPIISTIFVAITAYFAFVQTDDYDGIAGTLELALLAGTFFGYIIFYSVYKIIQESKLPGLTTTFFGLFLIVSGYPSLIPLNKGEIWEQWNTWTFILITFVILSLLSILLTIIKNKKIPRSEV